MLRIVNCYDTVEYRSRSARCPKGNFRSIGTIYIKPPRKIKQSFNLITYNILMDEMDHPELLCRIVTYLTEEQNCVRCHKELAISS